MRDPKAPAAQAVRAPRVRIGQRLERFIFERCRIHRGEDSIEVPPDAWQLVPVAGWPEAAYGSWSEATAELPALRAGDVVELAYAIHNHWSPYRQAAPWAAVPLPASETPTLERHIVMHHPAALEGWARVFGAPLSVIRHHGAAEPEWELLTGNLAPHTGSPARMLFAARVSWGVINRSLAPHFRSGARQCALALAPAGDSLLALARPTRERLEAILRYVDEHWARVPRSLTSCEFFPRSADEVLDQRTADRLDRAMLVMGLGRAAKLQIEAFLAAESEAGFRPDFVTPQQFDRVLVGTPVLEEGLFLIFDPWEADLEAAVEAARLPLLFGITDPVVGFREVSDEGPLVPRTFN